MSKTCPNHKTNITWPMVRLGDVCEGKIQRIKSISEPRIAYIDIASIDNVQKRVVGTKKYDVDDAPGRAQQVVIPGDVLVSNVRPNLNAVAIVDVASAVPLIASTGFCVLRVKDMVLPEYVYYYAQTSEFIDPLVAVSEKASYPSVTDTIVKDSLIPLPPLSEQREIVARLERELAAVEKMKKGFEALAETAKAEFKAELKEVFEGLKLCTETCKLGSLCKIKAGKKDVRQGNPHGEFPFFTCAKTCTFADTYSYDCAALLVAGNGDVGYTQKYVGKFEVYQRTYVLYDFKDVDIDFVYYLMAGEFQEWAYSKLMGNTMPYIKMGVLSEFQVPVPSPSVQHHTVSCLAEAKAHAEFLEAKAREGVAVCETMRKAILKEAFEGDVCEERAYG